MPATAATGAAALDDRTLQVLEYPRVVERLARLTTFSAGREAAMARRPVADRDVVVRRQRETAEAVHLDRVGMTVPLRGARDVRDRARGAARGQVLPPGDLLDVAAAAGAAGRVRRALERAVQDAPLLAEIAAQIPDVDAVRALVDGAIDERGEVLDDASPVLRAIRREIGEAHERLQQRMQGLLQAQGIRVALQEPIVTMRDGRYVIPVRADARGAVPGVVHDTSASGATVYVEPLAVVDLGNRWRELQVQERHEVERILREISEAVGLAAPDLVEAVERMAQLDVATACARLGHELDACALSEADPRAGWIVEAPGVLELVRARHPLLTGNVVPISLHVGGADRALLVTGPNTGGKTVALKTAGLLTLMALAGLPVPAEVGTRVPVFDSVFADIGDEQSIEQSLSTFSGHVTAIVDVIERAGPRSLVLLDEIGAGTDPTEGAALGIAIVDRLVAQGASLIATTHHSELKLYAHRTEGVLNASVEFDLETLSPTYRLTIGLPGQSNALAIAANLGMPRDVIERARSGLSSEQRDMETLLGSLRAQLNAAEQRAERAGTDAARAEAVRGDLERRLRALEEETARLREEARARVRREVVEVERLLEKARREIEAARLAQARADVRRAREQVQALEPLPAPEREAPEWIREAGRAIAPGVAVWLRGMGAPGIALDEPDHRGEFEVQLGALRTRVRIEQVEQTGTAPPDREGVRVTGAMPLFAAVPEEIEVRGRTLDEALPAVEQFIDEAARAGRHRVRLIHGRGTGTLRRAVRELCARHPLVTRYEPGGREEGGEGVTIAFLASVS